MSEDSKAIPKPILVQDDSDYDPTRVDRFGNKFKYLEQHISFKDEIMQTPLECVIEYDQVEVEVQDSSTEEKAKPSKEKIKKKRESDSTTSSENKDLQEPSEPKQRKAKKKGCSCTIQ